MHESYYVESLQMFWNRIQICDAEKWNLINYPLMNVNIFHSEKPMFHDQNGSENNMFILKKQLCGHNSNKCNLPSEPN